MKFSQDFLGILFIDASEYNAIWVPPTQTLLGKAISSSFESHSPSLVTFEVIRASEMEEKENDVGIPMIIKLLKRKSHGWLRDIIFSNHFNGFFIFLGMQFSKALSLDEFGRLYFKVILLDFGHPCTPYS